MGSLRGDVVSRRLKDRLIRERFQSCGKLIQQNWRRRFDLLAMQEPLHGDLPYSERREIGKKRFGNASQNTAPRFLYTRIFAHDISLA